MSSNDLLIEERDAKFRDWQLKKSLRDKAFEYLKLLDTKRAVDPIKLRQVAVSLQAVDKLLGNNELKNESQSKQNNENAGKSSSTKTMQSVWFKWAMEHHTFENVAVSIEDIKGFTGALKEYLQVVDEQSYIPSIKYFFPAAPKPGEPPKPLLQDQKAQNTIFQRECRKLWRSAKLELEEKINENMKKRFLSKKGK